VIRNAEKEDVAQSVGLVKDGRQGLTLKVRKLENDFLINNVNLCGSYLK
jgi:hypothetical protein